LEAGGLFDDFRFIHSGYLNIHHSKIRLMHRDQRQRFCTVTGTDILLFFSGKVAGGLEGFIYQRENNISNILIKK